MMQIRVVFWGIAVCACITTTVNAQKVYKYNLPGKNCYSELIFEETAVTPLGVILLDAHGRDIKQFAEQNSLLVSKSLEGYNFLYVNIIQTGTSTQNECYEVLVRTISHVYRINPDVFYLIENKVRDTSDKQSASKRGFNFRIIHQDLGNVTEILNELSVVSSNDGLYRVPDDYFASDWEYKNRMLNYARNFDVGVYFSPIILTGSKLNSTKDGLGTYGLSLVKNISQRSAIKFSVGGAYKMPNRKALQSGMQSKMMSAIQNGDDSLYLDEPLSGHVYFGGELSYRYSFNANKLFRPFLSVGIGMNTMTSISGRMQDTIDISDIDLSDQSSLQGKFNQDGVTMNQVSNRYLVPNIEFGFEYRLAPGSKFIASIPFRYYIGQSHNQYNTFSFGFLTGLSFTVNPTKMKPRKK